MRLLTTFILIATCVLAADIAWAMPQVSEAPPTRVGVGVTQRKLTLRDAIETALRANLDIEIEKTNVGVAEQRAQGALGYLDTTIRWQPLYQSGATPTSSILLGANGAAIDRSHAQNLYLRQRLPWGGSSLGLDFENNRISTNNPFVGLNPYFLSRLAFTITVPLFRGREIDRDRAEIRITRKEADIADVDYEVRVIDIIARVEQAYWNLSAARQAAQVNADGVEWAREQLARNQRMIQAGVLAPVELSAAEAELERRVDTYYQSLTGITEAENNLKTLLSDHRDAAIWNEEILPVDERVVLEPPVLEGVRETVTAALQKRPELRAIGLRNDVNQVQTELNRDLTKPQVNIVAGYVSQGLGGSVFSADNPFNSSNVLLYQRLNELSTRAGLTPVAPPNFGNAPPGGLVGGYGTSLSNLFAGNYNTYQAGLSIDFTARNRTAEANLAASRIGEKRIKLEQARAEQLIEAQVRNALQALESARQRRTAAEASARAAKEKLDSETRLYQNGESTNFFVLTRQNEYSDSRRRVVDANLDYNRAIARLQQAVGTTLSTHNVTLTKP